MPHEKNEEWQVILKAGFEGGCYTLYGMGAEDANWKFKMVSDCSTMESLLTEEDAAGIEFVTEHDEVIGWDCAMGAFLEEMNGGVAVEIHPEFHDRLLKEIEERLPERSRLRRSIERGRYRRRERRNRQ